MPISLPLASPQIDVQSRTRREGEKVLTVSVPLIAILGAVVFVAWRYMGLRAWQATLCLLFGFFIAATTAAPAIRNLVTAIVQGLTGYQPWPSPTAKE